MKKIWLKQVISLMLMGVMIASPWLSVFAGELKDVDPNDLTLIDPGRMTLPKSNNAHLYISKFEVYENPSFDSNNIGKGFLGIDTKWHYRYLDVDETKQEERDKDQKFLDSWYQDSEAPYINGTRRDMERSVLSGTVLYGRVNQQRNDTLVNIKLNNHSFQNDPKVDDDVVFRRGSTYYPLAKFAISDQKWIFAGSKDRVAYTANDGSVLTGQYNQHYGSYTATDKYDTNKALNYTGNDLRYSVRFYNPAWGMLSVFRLNKTIENMKKTFLGGFAAGELEKRKATILAKLEQKDYMESMINNPVYLPNRPVDNNVGDFQKDFNYFMKNDWLSKSLADLSAQMKEAMTVLIQKMGVRGYLANMAISLLSSANPFMQGMARNQKVNQYVPGGTSGRIPMVLNFTQTGEYTIAMDMYDAQKELNITPMKNAPASTNFPSYNFTPGASYNDDVMATISNEKQTRADVIKANNTTSYLKLKISQPHLYFDKNQNWDDQHATAYLYSVADKTYYHLDGEEKIKGDKDDTPLTIGIKDANFLADRTLAKIDPTRIRVSLLKKEGENWSQPIEIDQTSAVKTLTTLDNLKTYLVNKTDWVDGERYKVIYYYSAPDSVTKTSDEITLGRNAEISKEYAKKHDGLHGIVWADNTLEREIIITNPSCANIVPSKTELKETETVTFSCNFNHTTNIGDLAYKVELKDENGKLITGSVNAPLEYRFDRTQAGKYTATCKLDTEKDLVQACTANINVANKPSRPHDPTPPVTPETPPVTPESNKIPSKNEKPVKPIPPKTPEDKPIENKPQDPTPVPPTPPTQPVEPADPISYRTPEDQKKIDEQVASSYRGRVRKLRKLPKKLPQSWTPIFKRVWTRNAKNIETSLPNPEVFRLAGNTSEELKTWLEVLPEQDRYADTYLVLPSNGLVMPINTVLSGSKDENALLNWENIDFNKYLRNGALEYPGTSTNDYGQIGNKVIFGHSSYFAHDHGRYKTHFQKIIELNAGEQVRIFRKTTSWIKLFKYRVTESYDGKPTEVSKVLSDSYKSEITLFTCTPIGWVKGRWIVKAQLID